MYRSQSLQARGRLNALQRHRKPDDPEILEARRDLKVERAEEYIAQLVDSAPPLNDSQRLRLAGILTRPAGRTPVGEAA